MSSTDRDSTSSPLFTAEEVVAGLDVAEMIPLLMSVAAARRDSSILDHQFQPALLTPAVGALAQGGLDAQAVAALRTRLTALLESLTEEDAEFKPLSDDFLKDALSFMTGEVDEGYLPIMRRELNWGEDVARPSREIGERSRGRRVAIIGGGISGVALAVRLAQAGVDFVVFEKNAELGGTWVENIYPGCRLDTSNFGYSYSFAQQTWKHYFSEQTELRDYVQRIAEEESVLSHVRFGTEVTSMTWTGRAWDVVFDGDTETFDFVVSAVGQLNRPKMPEIAGIDDFAGEAWHSAQWPADADIDGKRVAIIGTGASGYQIAPAIAEQVGSLSIFQRTPPWIFHTPAYTAEIPAAYMTVLERFPAYRRWLRFYQFWISMDGRLRFAQADPAWDVPGSVSATNLEFREVLEQSIRDQFADRPDLLPAVVPDYPPGSKRILRDDGAWARTLKRDDVDLVTEGIDHIEADAVVLTSGRRVEVDVIVYATGFQADRFLTPMKVIGVDGTVLSEQWGELAETYLGMSVNNFPNFVMYFGPNTNLVVNGSAVYMFECMVDRVLRMVDFLSDDDVVSFDVPERLVREFVDEADEANSGMAWGVDGVRNFYKGKTGRVVAIWPFSMRRYWEQTSRNDFVDWNVVRESELVK